MLVTIT